MTVYETLKSRLEALDARMYQLMRENSLEKKPEIMAVTKTHPWEVVSAALTCGIAYIGESRVQEMHERFNQNWKEAEKKKAQLCFIGHLQKNKIKKALQYVDAIHSVDDAETLILINKEAEKLGKQVSVYLEFNSSGEAAKQGVLSWEGLLGLAVLSRDLAYIRLDGIMTLGPLGNNELAIRTAFAKTRNYCELLRKEGFSSCAGLSMGMSDDWEFALKEGSTMLRLGTILFGPRDYL